MRMGKSRKTSHAMFLGPQRQKKNLQKDLKFGVLSKNLSQVGAERGTQ